MMRYLVIFEGDNIRDEDFERVTAKDEIEVENFLTDLVGRFSGLYQRYKLYHIWETDENYKPINRAPVVSGGIDGLLAVYNNRGL